MVVLLTCGFLPFIVVTLMALDLIRWIIVFIVLSVEDNSRHLPSDMKVELTEPALVLQSIQGVTEVGLTQWFSSGGSCVLRRHLAMPGDSFRLLELVGGAAGFWQVEARDVAKRSAMHRKGPTKKKDPALSVSGVTVEKPWVNGVSLGL